MNSPLIPKSIQSGPCEALDCDKPKHYMHTIPFQFCVEHLTAINQDKEVVLK